MFIPSTIESTEQLDVSIIQDMHRGFSLQESLIRSGVVQFDDIKSDKPWEIDEDNDAA
jgi:hypothetical protein